MKPEVTQGAWTFTRHISSRKNLLTTISDIMDLSRIESGEMAVQVSEVSVPALLLKIRHEYMAKARAKDLEWLSPIFPFILVIIPLF